MFQLDETPGADPHARCCGSWGGETPPATRFAWEKNMIRNCPICDNAAANCIAIEGIAIHPWELVRCCRCKFVFLRNPPCYETLASDFSWDTTYEEEKRLRRSRQSLLEQRIRQILIFIKKTWHRLFRRNKLCSIVYATLLSEGTCVDLGSDTGYNAIILPDYITPVGIEISSDLAQKSKGRFESRGGKVINAPALQGLMSLPSNSFAGALAISYLEHESCPRAVLSELHRVLQPMAPLIIKVPNYGCWIRFARGKRWSGYRFPDHVNYFTPESLTRILCDSGYAIRRFGFADRCPTSDNMWCVAIKN